MVDNISKKLMNCKEVDIEYYNKIVSTKPKSMTKKTEYTFDYPSILKIEKEQMENFWLPTEPKVEKDLQCILSEVYEDERHGIVTCLKLFTLYELVAGLDYWSGKFKRLFPRPDFERMATAFSMFELNIHAPFYDEINKLLGLSTDEFYNSYVNDPILKSRMEFLDKMVGADSRKTENNNVYEDLKSVGVFSMVEGSVLYSNFAYLKSFQSNGDSRMINMEAGLDFSCRDENLHSIGGATAFNIAIDELKKEGLFIQEEYDKLVYDLTEAARYIGEHEFRIIDMIFEKGDRKNMKESMKQFVRSRINLCLNNIQIPSIYSYEEIGENLIATWFYKNINSATIHDFFLALGSQYNRDWSEKAFIIESNKYTLED